MARDPETSTNKILSDDRSAELAETASSKANEREAQGDGFADLSQNHKTLRALLGEGLKVSNVEEAENLLPRLVDAWAHHAEAQSVLYDAAAEVGLHEFPLLTETAIDTDLVTLLLGSEERILDGRLELASLRVAVRIIGEIIEREEKPRSGLFAKAKAAGVDPVALGGRIRAHRKVLSDQIGASRPQLRHLMAKQEDIMPRNSNMPERDERGRFISDDDDNDRGRRGSGRYDDDRDRDSRGRFTSGHDDDRGGRSRHGDDRDQDSRGGSTNRRGDDDRRGSSRYDDDRGRDSRGRFTSDDDRSSSRGRSSRRDDDDERRYAASRRDDDDRRSYSSRNGDDYTRDRGQGGWFGDSRGHSEAARLGWERRDEDDDSRSSSRGRSSRRDEDDDRRNSSSRRDDDRGSYSRNRDDDYSRDRGQGGWFGDSEGHSEAARRGWDNRRDDDDDDDDRRSSRGRR